MFRVTDEENNYDKIIVCVEYNGDDEIITLLKDSMMKAFQMYLKSYEIPSEIIVIDTMPRNLNGKPLRNNVRKTYDKGEYRLKLKMKNGKHI